MMMSREEVEAKVAAMSPEEREALVKQELVGVIKKTQVLEEMARVIFKGPAHFIIGMHVLLGWYKNQLPEESRAAKELIDALDLDKIYSEWKKDEVKT